MFPAAELPTVALSPSATALLTQAAKDLYLASTQKVQEEIDALTIERGATLAARMTAEIRLNEIDERMAKLKHALTNFQDLSGALDPVVKL